MNDVFETNENALANQEEIENLRNQLEEANKRLLAISDRAIISILLFNTMPDGTINNMSPKIAAIKLLRSNLDWGLKESKDYVEAKTKDWGFDLLNLAGRVKENDDGSFDFLAW